MSSDDSLEMVDFVEIFPTEISQNIFSYLSAEDLWNTFSVSPSWKNITNHDFLWRRLCSEIDMDIELERFKIDNGYSDLCKYAKIWGVWRWKTVRNWEEDRYYELTMQTKYPCIASNSCVTSNGDCLAISDGIQIFVFSKKNADIETLLKEIFKDRRDYSFVRALEMNKHYLIVLRNTSVVVYRTTDFKPYLLINFVAGRLEITRDNFSRVSLSDNSSVEFVLLHEHSLWIGEYLFLKSAVIVDLETGEYREVSFPWKCTLMSLNENVIARTDSLLAVYSLSGEKSFEMKILDYSLLNTSKNVLALITDHEIHTYNRLDGKRIGQIKKSFFDFHINYQRDLIYGLSKTKEKFKVVIEAVSLLNGYSHWSVTQFGEFTSEVRSFLGIFLCYTCTQSEFWYILDEKSGKCLHKKPIPKHGFLSYVSDLFWVCQTPEMLIIRFY